MKPKRSLFVGELNGEANCMLCQAEHKAELPSTVYEATEFAYSNKSDFIIRQPFFTVLLDNAYKIHSLAAFNFQVRTVDVASRWLP